MITIVHLVKKKIKNLFQFAEKLRSYIASKEKCALGHVKPFNPLHLPKNSFPDIVSNVILNQRQTSFQTTYDMPRYEEKKLGVPL